MGNVNAVQTRCAVVPLPDPAAKANAFCLWSVVKCIFDFLGRFFCCCSKKSVEQAPPELAALKEKGKADRERWEAESALSDKKHQSELAEQERRHQEKLRKMDEEHLQGESLRNLRKSEVDCEVAQVEMDILKKQAQLKEDKKSHIEKMFRKRKKFFETFYGIVLKNGELQESKSSYLCEKLECVTGDKLNLPVRLDKSPKGIGLYAKGSTFYAYNGEGVRDYGWGCSWRTLQTSLSVLVEDLSFAQLFHTFGLRENLEKIYRNKYPNEFLTSSKPFAPYELASGWAEPFIGEMVMHFCGISADLESVNSVPSSCYAPQSVFHNPPISFADFKGRLEVHFKGKKPVPVMIDDGLCALNIVGIGSEGEEVVLWIADPHIQEGVNLQGSQEGAVGLYTVRLSGDGRQVSCSLDSEDADQKDKMFCSDSYAGLHFNEKSWMVLFPRVASSF